MFQNTIQTSASVADYLVGASICLHNFILTEDPTALETAELELLKINDYQQLRSIPIHSGSNSSAEARAIRDKLSEYFSLDGAVEWQ